VILWHTDLADWTRITADKKIRANQRLISVNQRTNIMAHGYSGLDTDNRRLKNPCKSASHQC